MKITILAVGRVKEKFYTDAVNEYAKRLSRSYSLTIDEAGDEPTPDRASDAEKKHILDREGERLEKMLDRYPSAYVIALSIDGRAYDSVSFSEHISELKVRGRSHIVFLIGGSLGLSERVLRRSDERISFSKMTFPHQLMRVILLEQLYRADRIALGQPYHK